MRAGPIALSPPIPSLALTGENYLLRALSQCHQYLSLHFLLLGDISQFEHAWLRWCAGDHRRLDVYESSNHNQVALISPHGTRDALFRSANHDTTTEGCAHLPALAGRRHPAATYTAAVVAFSVMAPSTARIFKRTSARPAIPRRSTYHISNSGACSGTRDNITSSRKHQAGSLLSHH